MILGSDFLSERQALLDFENKTLSWDGLISKLGKKGSPDPATVNYLVYTEQKTIVAPRSGRAFKVRPEWGTPAGTYVATMLDNGPAIRDHFGVDMPDAVVVVRGKERPVLSIINETDDEVVLPKGCEVAALELVMPDTIQPAVGNQSQNSVSNDIAQVSSPNMDRTDVTPEQRAGLSALIEENEDLFAKSDADLGCTPLVEMKIDTGEHPPIQQRPYRVPISQRAIIEKHVRDKLDAGIFRPFSSPWASPVFIVPKPDGFKWFCIDHRKVNQATLNNAYPCHTWRTSYPPLAGPIGSRPLTSEPGIGRSKWPMKTGPRPHLQPIWGCLNATKCPSGWSMPQVSFKVLAESSTNTHCVI